jgi:2-haloacid dehalogenase
MNLDGLFIDMYGTLTTGDKAAVEAVCRNVVRDTGAILSAPELAILWGERFLAELEACNGDAFQTLFGLESDSLVRTLAAQHVTADPAPYVAQLAEYWRNPPLQPEVREFLAACPAPLCIVSNADRADLLAALDRLEVRVAGVITSEDARSYKPHTAIFEAALERTGWRRDRVLHIGDSLHSDIAGARAAGLRSAWINRAHRIHDIGTCAPDIECADLLGLLAAIEADGRV